MRILYVITQADGGGAQKYVLQLAGHFKGTVAAGNEAGELFTSAKNLQLTTYNLQHLKRSISPWHDFLAIFEIRRLIKKLNPDIVHLNSSKAGILGSFAGAGLKTKMIFTAHGFVFNEPLPRPVRLLYLALEKMASYFRDYIIAVSEADRISALRHHIINPKKIGVLYNGISAINFLDKTAARQKLNLPNDKFVFGTVANFYKTKGLDILIEAIGQLDNNLCDKFQMIFIGEGTQRPVLESLIKKYQLKNTVKLLGNVPEVGKYLKAFDAFVLPSRKEGFSYTILEALQAGLPTLATDVGGNKEAINDAGILVEPENPRALANGLSLLLGGELLAQTLGEKALQRSKLFTLEKMLEETKKVYEQLLRDKN